MQVGNFYCEGCGTAVSPSRLYCSHGCAHKATQAAMADRQSEAQQLKLGLHAEAFQLPLRLNPG